MKRTSSLDNSLSSRAVPAWALRVAAADSNPDVQSFVEFFLSEDAREYISDTGYALLDDEERLLRELAEVEHKNVAPERKSFFERLKDYFVGDEAPEAPEADSHQD